MRERRTPAFWRHGRAPAAPWNAGAQRDPLATDGRPWSDAVGRARPWPGLPWRAGHDYMSWAWGRARWLWCGLLVWWALGAGSLLVFSPGGVACGACCCCTCAAPFTPVAPEADVLRPPLPCRPRLCAPCIRRQAGAARPVVTAPPRRTGPPPGAGTAVLGPQAAAASCPNQLLADN